MAIGFGLLIITSVIEDNFIFLVKKIVSFILIIEIIGQIFYHEGEHWHYENDEICRKCGEELEPHWRFCVFVAKEEKPKEKNKINIL